MLMLLSVIAAGTGVADAAPAPPAIMQLIPWVLLPLIFYFLLIAPARKQKKKHEALLANLKPGDKVVTNGGMLGTVHAVHDQIVQLRVAPEVKVEFSKSAIAGFQEQPE